MLMQVERYGEALPHLERSVAIARRVHGDEHWIVGAFRLSLGKTLTELGRLEEARVELTTSLSLIESGLGADHSRATDVRTALDILRKLEE